MMIQPPGFNMPAPVYYDWLLDNGQEEQAAELRRRIIAVGQGKEVFGIPAKFCREFCGECEPCKVALVQAQRELGMPAIQGPRDPRLSSDGTP